MIDESIDENERLEFLVLASNIVSAHVSNNSVSPSDLPALIQQVFSSLTKLGTAPALEPAAEQKPVVSIRKSVTPDYIVCLEDGKKLKMLKRHLRTSYDMSPDEYRKKWGLPGDYPMVAPNYSIQRKDLAIKIGLGRKAGESPKNPRGRPRKQAA